MLITKSTQSKEKTINFFNFTIILGLVVIIGIILTITIRYFFELNQNYSHRIVFKPTDQFSSNPVEIILGVDNKCKKCQIRYTLDGTKPTLNSQQYLDPITINQSTAIRARVFQNMKAVSMIHSKTYFVNESTQLPIVSLITEPKNLWDPDIGIYTQGNNYNYDQKGPDWERPAHLEYFEKNKKLGFEMDLKIKLHGRTTRKTDQKSFKLCADPDYGPARINYQIFKNREIDSFECIILRNSGNDWSQTMFRDGLMHSLIEDLNIDNSAYQPTVTYINGQYFGIQNLRQLTNEDYLASKYNISTKDITILTHKNGPLFEDKGYPELVHGSEEHQKEYLELLNHLENHSASYPNNYNYIKSQIDISNYIDYIVSQTYWANLDWPHGNVDFWRYEQDFYTPNAREELDGRWRWIVYDTDAGFALYTGNFESKKVEPIADQDMTRKFDKHEFRFTTLFENREFLEAFLNRYADLLNTTFKPKKVITKIDLLANQIRNEIPRHANRWQDAVDSWDEHSFQNKTEWEENVSYLKEFARERPNYVYLHLSEYFNLPGVSTIEVVANTDATVRLNTIDINTNHRSWTGYYFNTIPITLTAQPKKGYKFDHWEINPYVDLDNLENLNLTEETIEIEVNRDLTFKAVYKEKKSLF